MKLVRPIRSEKEYDTALERVSVLMSKSESRSQAETDEYEVLLDVVESYENKAHPLPEPSLGAVLTQHLENLGHDPSVLVFSLGSIETVNRVLSGHQMPSMLQLESISHSLGIPMASLAKAVEAA